ncbi:velvet factor-domain-containing protein [Absidia repens]|uniref:Velvet factor-domain-containing protein n=1 Tax=Absidia repens TaxID=90262 RepID=A0A1X2IWP2_9FUNG|nr:velvet factor-domain-containing protein [Absidia repens]
MTASSLVDSTSTNTSTSTTTVTNPNNQSDGMQQSYRLIVRQQPEKARLCSFKEKVDRRPLDPPPIVQLLTDKSNIQYPYFFLYATLVTETGDKDLTFLDNARTTAGTTVQSLHRLRDRNNEDGAFFIFADVSIRMEGFFRLRFTLFEIIESYATCRCSVLSDAFQVYSPKSFPGMSESTFLTRSFSEQGVRIRIRKETRTNLLHPNKRRRSDGNHEQTATTTATSTTPRHQSLPTIKSTHSIMSMKNILISPVRESTTFYHQHSPPSPSSSPPTRVLPYPNPTVFHHHQRLQQTSSPASAPPTHPHQSNNDNDSTQKTSFTPNSTSIPFTTSS